MCFTVGMKGFSCLKESEGLRVGSYVKCSLDVAGWDVVHLPNSIQENFQGA